MKSAGDSVTKHDGGKEGEKFAVGKVYAVKLTNEIEFNGIVLAYDVDPDFVIFEEGTKSRPGSLKDIRTVNAKFITELKYLGKVKDYLAAKKHSIDLNGLLAKEKLAIRKIEGISDGVTEEESIFDALSKTEIERISAGVTEEAQSIFDALSKTLPVQWDKSDILVMSEVRICSPYTSDCVTGGTRPAKKRVERVLEMERKKLQLSGTGGN